MSSLLQRLTTSVTAALAISTLMGSASAQPTPKGTTALETAGTNKAHLQDAKKHMEAGAAFYNDPSGHKCEEAYREFKKAYELSGSLKALRAMGICALELERDGEAIERLEKYLEAKGTPIEASDKTQIESDLKALKAAVGRVTFRSGEKEEVRITDVRIPSKGSPITNDYVIRGEQTLGIHPGRHTFTASIDGGPSLTWTVDVANGGTYEHTFEFSKTAPGGVEVSTTSKGPAQPLRPSIERPVSATVFVVGGLTVALAVPTVVFMVRASGKNDDFDSQNGKLPKAALESMRSDVKSANVIADIFLGATVASLAATGVLFFTRPARPAEKAGTWTLAPVASRSGGGALMAGRF